MRTRHFKFIVLPLLGVVAILLAPFVIRPAPSVSLTVRSFKIFPTNNPNGYYLHGPKIGRDYVAAYIDIHNTSSHSVTYWLAQSSVFVDYYLRYSTLLGWEDHTVTRPRSCQKQYTLAPGQRAEFWAVIDSDRPCRVALNYSRPPGRLWQRLPQSITKRWPFGKSSAQTETIDWRHLPTERQDG
jgi:hypothetical protein